MHVFTIGTPMEGLVDHVVFSFDPLRGVHECQRKVGPLMKTRQMGGMYIPEKSSHVLYGGDSYCKLYDKELNIRGQFYCFTPPWNRSIETIA